MRVQSISHSRNYIAQRARGAHVASICRPDCIFSLSLASQFPRRKANNNQAVNYAIMLRKIGNVDKTLICSAQNK